MEEDNDDKDKEEGEVGEEEEEEESDKVAMVTEPGNCCLDIIEQIRQEEFGVDIQLSEDGQKLMKKQQERLGRYFI